MKRVLAVIFAGIIVGAVGFVAPAYAYANCPATLFCTYDGANGSGAQYNYNSSTSGCVPIGSTWNDRISSVSNHLTNGRTVVMYQHAGCNNSSGWRFTVQNPQDLSLDKFTNNQVSSMRF